MSENEPKVSEEAAEHEFNRFCETWDLDVDPAGMDEDDKKSLTIAKRRFVRAVMDGRMVVDESGCPTYTPRYSSNPTSFTFSEPSGAAILEADKFKKNADVAKTFGVMSGITGRPVKSFSALKKRDLDVVMAIFNLFMGG
jgi:hypothetical protein